MREHKKPCNALVKDVFRTVSEQNPTQSFSGQNPRPPKLSQIKYLNSLSHSSKSPIMRFSLATVLISFATMAFAATTMQSISFMAGGIEKRDVCVPVPEPATCAASCGPGNEQCVYPLNCYNPTKGEKCCSNGSRSNLVLRKRIDESRHS